MPTADVIAFLALIVALSAYIATIRLRLIDKIRETTDTDRKSELKLISFWLTFADAPLIISGVLLFFHSFWDLTIGLWFATPGAPKWLLPWSIGFFAFGGAVLVVHHAVAWWKSITAK